jgi:DNA-binding CsgD family transcriptional regulator
MRKRKTEENDYLSSFIDKLQTNKLRIGLEKDAYTLIIQELISQNYPIPCAMYMLNLQQEEFIYISSEISALLGYAPEDFTNYSYQKYLELFHIDDIAGFKGPVYENFVCYIKSQKKHEIRQLKFSVNYRVKNKNGEYIKILDQFMVVKTDKTKNPVIILGVLSDISSHKNDNNMVLTIHNPSSETKKEVNKSVKHIFTKKPSFTLRQKEIIELIGNGYSSKEIAQQLELSLHTVHAHRRKLLYKFNCKNTSELLNMYHSEIS